MLGVCIQIKSFATLKIVPPPPPPNKSVVNVTCGMRIKVRHPLSLQKAQVLMSNFSLLLCDSAARIGLDNLFQISGNLPQLAETQAGEAGACH